MQAKFRREYPFGKERFRGLLVWVNPDGVKQRAVCDSTRSTKQTALQDAEAMRPQVTAWAQTART